MIGICTSGNAPSHCIEISLICATAFTENRCKKSSDSKTKRLVAIREKTWLEGTKAA